jgi:hypothetical protein
MVLYKSIGPISMTCPGLKMMCKKYASFLLRISQGNLLFETAEQEDWRVEIDLEHIQTGRHWTYASLDELIGFFCLEEGGLDDLEWQETYPDE